MRAWLERITPPGGAITLPAGSGALTFGRSPRATVVFDDKALSARHCEVAWADGFWRLRDLGTALGTRLNGQPLTSARALFPGDEVQFGGVVLRFRDDAPVEDPALLEAVAAHPDDVTPWLVYADKLQEAGDPLGERIVASHAGGRVNHQPWVGPLWDELVSGALEVDWWLGFAQRVTLRTVAGRLPIDWRQATAHLFNLRVGRLLRALVVDLPRLEPGAPLDEALASAQAHLAATPALPPTLERLELGYEVTPAGGGLVETSDALARRLPRLEGCPVFHRARGCGLLLEWESPGARVSGLDAGRRALTGVVRLRKDFKRQLHLESPPGLSALVVENPCHFTLHEGGVRLVTGNLRRELRVNGRVDGAFDLLPGDVVEAPGLARFRFEVLE